MPISSTLTLKSSTYCILTLASKSHKPCYYYPLQKCHQRQYPHESQALDTHYAEYRCLPRLVSSGCRSGIRPVRIRCLLLLRQLTSRHLDLWNSILASS
jgi:hypothetical protein